MPREFYNNLYIILLKALRVKESLDLQTHHVDNPATHHYIVPSADPPPPPPAFMGWWRGTAALQSSRQTSDIMLGRCWAIVYDAGPTSPQHSVSVPRVRDASSDLYTKARIQNITSPETGRRNKQHTPRNYWPNFLCAGPDLPRTAAAFHQSWGVELESLTRPLLIALAPCLLNLSPERRRCRLLVLLRTLRPDLAAPLPITFRICHRRGGVVPWFFSEFSRIITDRIDPRQTVLLLQKVFCRISKLTCYFRLGVGIVD